MLLEKNSLFEFSISTTSLGMEDQLLGTRKVGVTKMICRFSIFFCRLNSPDSKAGGYATFNGPNN
ncbi:hypothetical protein RDI58_010753 [Solanum bulbocastanum]|uniref:Uncharacterized protein n=1 Tax=Solanum bulbocastanum TaxID=147425 RepID=A0AAN8TUF8_SOLBU